MDDRDRYLELVEQLHQCLTFDNLSFDSLENLKSELEALLGRVTFHKNRNLLTETSEILSKSKNIK